MCVLPIEELVASNTNYILQKNNERCYSLVYINSVKNQKQSLVGSAQQHPVSMFFRVRGHVMRGFSFSNPDMDSLALWFRKNYFEELLDKENWFPPPEGKIEADCCSNGFGIMTIKIDGWTIHTSQSLEVLVNKIPLGNVNGLTAERMSSLTDTHRPGDTYVLGIGDKDVDNGSFGIDFRAYEDGTVDVPTMHEKIPTTPEEPAPSYEYSFNVLLLGFGESVLPFWKDGLGFTPQMSVGSWRYDEEKHKDLLGLVPSTRFHIGFGPGEEHVAFFEGMDGPTFSCPYLGKKQNASLISVKKVRTTNNKDLTISWSISDDDM